MPAAVSPETRPDRRRARPVASAWFASDMHLHGGDPAAIGRALAFLRAAEEAGVDALFLLGDVFLAWLGEPSLDDPGLSPFLEGLRRLVARGVRVVLVHGNHDYLMGRELERALGVEVHAQGLDVALGGERARLLHGDAFCTRDLGYQRLHRVLRHPLVRMLARALPVAALRWVAGRLVHGANRSTAGKSAREMGIVDGAVEALLASGRDVAVCGHVHTARDARLGDGRLVVLADFETTGSHAVWDGDALTLRVRDDRFAPPPGVVVTLDGPAGSGKSAVARRLAEVLGFVVLDSGALYRAVTAAALERGLTPGDPGLGALAASLDLTTDALGRVLRDGEVLEDDVLRGPEVSAAVSPVSADPAVRGALLEVQRRAARRVRGLVAEGRDMASVVFPRAEHRFFLDAPVEVRAARRLAQNPGEGRSLEQVVAALRARDERDSGRAVAPLRVADGAERIDTSGLDLEGVVALLARRVGAPAG